MPPSNATTQHFVMRTVAEAARETAVPEETIRAWIETGELPARQIGRTTLVNLLAVQSLSLRVSGEPLHPDRDWSLFYRRPRSALRALGAANLLTGVAGLSVFAGIGPDDLRTGWWLVGCLTSIAVGFAEWFGLPRNR